MADLSCKYLGLSLKTPLIAASSPLTGTIEGLKKCENAGASAVVLKSIFEEQIDMDASRSMLENEAYLSHSDFTTYFENISKDFYLNQYLELLKAAKKELSIPVIASINCRDGESWVEYVKEFEKAGADALELNYYPIATEAAVNGKQVEKDLFAFAKKVRELTKLPISLKLGCRYSALANIVLRLDQEKIDGLVMFNRFFSPDIDIDKIELTSHPVSALSGDHEYADSLRWIALMSAEVGTDLCASTGIHSGETVVKQLLAGAAACQICSAALKDINVFSTMAKFVSDWMDSKGYATISDFKGKLAQENMVDGTQWERTQYMRTLLFGGND